MTASTSALVPSGSVSIDVRPGVEQRTAALDCPARTANRNGVNEPPFERASTSAPASMSSGDRRRVVLGGGPHQRVLSLPPFACA